MYVEDTLPILDTGQLNSTCDTCVHHEQLTALLFEVCEQESNVLRFHVKLLQTESNKF